jgi:hypothetical protein
LMTMTAGRNVSNLIFFVTEKGAELAE